MSITYDCSSSGLAIIIEGVTCNCSTEQHKKAVCTTIQKMNNDEKICIERRQFNNPNLPPYSWSIVFLGMNGITILENNQNTVNVYANAQDLPFIYQVFEKQIRLGTNWCTL